MSIEGWNGDIHPAAELFPLMGGDDFDALVASIREQGLREAVWVASDGRLLDGRNRIRACHRLGVKSSFRQYGGDDPVAFVMALNMERRHLTTGQRAMLALKIVPMYEAEAAGRVGGRPRNGEKPVAELPQVSQPKSRDSAGAAAKVSGRAVQQAKRIAAADPVLAQQVADGTKNLNQAEAEARQIEARRRAEEERTDELHDTIVRLRAGETIVVNMRDDLSRALEAHGLVLRIDRGTPWGNPFILDDDGDRDEVIAKYRDHYLPHKPSLKAKLPTLRGRALGCWCAPQACHGDVLKAAL